MTLLALLACAPAPTIETVAGIGGVSMAGGDGLPAQETGLYLPTALAWDPRGRLVIDDFNNFRIRRLEPDGTLTTLAGWGVHGWATLGADPLRTDLENPIDVAWLPDGRMLIAEMHSGRVLVVDEVIGLLAGGWLDQVGHGGDGGPATQAVLSEIRGVAAGEDGRVWISDTDNHCVRVVDEDGVIRHVAGDLAPGFSDGGVEARFSLPERVRIRGRHLWVADTQNHAIRRIDTETFEVETVAGTGVPGFDGDGGPAVRARLQGPTGVWPLADGGFAIADSQNHRVRLVDADGVITTVAGSGKPGFAGDGGPASEARLNWPADVLGDEDGNLYVADLVNSAVRVVWGAFDPGE